MEGWFLPSKNDNKLGNYNLCGLCVCSCATSKNVVFSELPFEGRSLVLHHGTWTLGRCQSALSRCKSSLLCRIVIFLRQLVLVVDGQRLMYHQAVLAQHSSLLKDLMLRWEQINEWVAWTLNNVWVYFMFHCSNTLLQNWVLQMSRARMQENQWRCCGQVLYSVLSRHH